MPNTPAEPGKTLPRPLTRKEIEQEIEARVSRIHREFSAAFEFLKNYPSSVSIFGSSRFPQENQHCKKAEHLAGRIVRELGYAVITGGSAGIMEAANKGALEAGGESVGLNIKLPKEQRSNVYTSASIDFSFFFVRKVALSFSAEAYLFFPGGFGTLDEFFEIVTLVQTHKIRRVPIFLVGKDYWEPLLSFIRENLFEIHRAVDKEDLELYRVTDSEDEIIATIKGAPIHGDEFRHRVRT